MTNIKSKNKFIKAATSTALVASSLSAVAVPISAASFSDIENSSHKESINALVERGIVKGFEDGTFKPGKAITRGQAAKIIASVLQLDIKNIENPQFSDISEDMQYYPYIAALAKANIISGYKDGTFKQNQTITRGQMAKMIAIGFNLETKAQHPFTDVSSKSSYAPYISALYANEVTTGTSETTFSPAKHVTRGQLASFVIRAEKINSKPITSDLSGIVTATTGDTLTIDGNTLAGSAEIAKFIEHNAHALEGAAISVSVKDNEITAIEKLEINADVTTFDGKNVTIATLSLPASITTVQNVTANEIHYAVNNEALTVNNVIAKEFFLNNEKYVVASTDNVTAPLREANVTFNGSTIEKLTVNVRQAKISKTNSTISHLIASNVEKLELNGDYKNVTIAPTTVLEGNAIIENLHFTAFPTKHSISNTISVAKVTINNRTYSWDDFLTAYANGENGNNESNDGDDSSTGGSSNTGGGSSSEDNSNTDDNSSSEDNANTDGNSSSEDNANTDGNSSSEDNANTDGNSSSEDNANTDGNSSSEDNQNTNEENTTPSNPDTPAIEIDETNNTVTVDDTTYNLSDEQKAALLAIQHVVEEAEFVSDGQQTTIQSLTVNTEDFDGSALQNINVQSLTLLANTVQNISNVDTLQVTDVQFISNIDVDNLSVSGNVEQIIATTANEVFVNSTASHLLINATANNLNLQNSTANVEVKGNISNIEGGQAGALIIASLASAVEVGRVGATEIIVNDTTAPVVASLNFARSLFTANTSESNFKISFTGDYASKILTINRKDTIVDVQSPTPFSKVNISGNDTILNSNKQLAEVFVSSGVTHLTLNAAVDNLELNLNSPIQLVSTASLSVNTLVLKTNTTNSTDGWVSLLNVVPAAITLNGAVIDLNHNIFKQDSVSNGNNYPLFNSSISEFDPDDFSKYGTFKLTLPNGSGTYYIAQVSKGENVNNYLTASNTSNATIYNPSVGFKLAASTQQVVVYETNGTAITGVSMIDTSQIAPFQLSINQNTGVITLMTRYDGTKTVKDQMKYFYIFKDGSLIYEETNFSNNSFNTANGPAQVKLETGLTSTLTGGSEVYITDGYILYRKNKESVAPYFSQILTTLAEKAHKANDPERIHVLLASIANNEDTTFDSLFLAEYVKAISENKNKYMNDLDAILDLIDELTPEYQLNIQLSAEDLFLSSAPSANTATYSVNNIVKVQEATTAGKIMFTPLATGTTTVRITDQNQNATLINVKVTEQNGKLVIADGDYKVISTEVEQGTLLDGTNNFRFFTNGAKTYLVPTKFEDSFALVKTTTVSSEPNDPIGYEVYGYALTRESTGVNLVARGKISPIEIKLADLALQSIAGLNVKNVGVLSNANNDGIILFPRKAGTEIAYFSDTTNVTGVNIVATETSISYTIAKSAAPLNIKEDLRLDAITKATIHPQNSLDIHYKKDGDTVQFFTNTAAKVAYVFSDSGNRHTIVNVESSLDFDGKLTVTNGEIVKKDISIYDNNTPNDSTDDIDNTSATVTNISGTSIRNHNLEIFATETGTSIVTLSNGNQYEFDVKQSNNLFTIDVEKVTNVIIEANTLHMTNIKEATSSNASDRLQVVDGKLIVNLAADGTSKITVKSDTEPVETTVLYVTKNGDTYTFDPANDIVRAELEPNKVGLTSITNAFGESTSSARIKVTNNTVYVYGFTEGNRSFRVSDGTNSTAINTTVTTVDNKLKVSAEAVKYTNAVQENATISSTAARVVGTELYATGLGLDTNGQATIEIPVSYSGTDADNVQAFDSIVLSKHPDTNLLSFGTATKTFKKAINKADFDFSTLHSPTVSSIPNNTLTADGISAAIAGDQLIVTSTKNSEGRVQINESSDAAKNAFVYVKNDGTNFTAIVEKSAATTLNEYGYAATPSAITQPYTVEGIVRAHIDPNFNLDFYALTTGKTVYKIEDGNGKNLFVNVEVNNKATETATETNQHYVHTSIVESDELPVNTTDASIKATIIEGDAVRLSADKTKLYANKLGTKSIVKYADGNFAEYEVVVNADGHYELKDTPIAKSATITKAILGLDGSLQVSGLDSSIASYSVTDEGIVVYGADNGTTAMTVSNGSKSVVVNVTVTEDDVTISSPITTTITGTTTLIDPNDANIVRIDGTTVYALAAGTAEILVKNESTIDGEVVVTYEVQQITVAKNADNQYSITAPEKISDAVYSAADLGFEDNAAMTIETGYDTDNFVVTNIDGKIVAYSKLTGASTGTTEFVVKASNERTLVNLTDSGATILKATIAKEEITIASDTLIADTTIARHKDGVVYALKAGSTYATKANGYIQAVNVTRIDGLLVPNVVDVKLEGSFAPLAETNKDEAIIAIDSNGDIYALKTSGKTVVKEGNQVYEITISNTNNKIEISKKAISSKVLTAEAAQLKDIKTAEVLYPTNSTAVTLSVLSENNLNDSLAIYSNATAAQSLAVLVTDSDGHKAIIDVTIDVTGAIIDAEYVKHKIENVKLSANKIVQTTNARGVWEGTTLTTYAIAEGNAALKFTNGLVNVTATKSATNKVTMTANILEHTGLVGTIKNVTNGAMVQPVTNGFYPTDVGTALIYTDDTDNANDKVYSVTVTLENGLYKQVVSAGVPFTTLAIGQNAAYEIVGSTLNGVSIAIDPDSDDNGTEDDKQLIIYKEGSAVGTSDLVITSDSLKTIYQVKTDATTVSAPKEAKKDLETFAGATLEAGTSVRLSDSDADLINDTIYYLEEKASTLKHNGRLVTVDVTRDAEGFFTATPQYVTGTLNAVAIPGTSTDPSPLTNYEIHETNRKIVYATSTTIGSESLLLPDPSDNVKAYYATFSTTRTGDKFAVEIDERKAYQYDPADYGMQTTITTVKNTNDAVATAKVVTDLDGKSKIVIIAGTGSGSTTITLTDGSKQLIVKASRESNGNFVVTPQASLNSVQFADMDLVSEQTALITATNFKEDVISVTSTMSGLNITAHKVGETSIQLIKNNTVVGLVNVIVEEVNDDLQVKATPVSFKTTFNQKNLHTTPDISAREHSSEVGTYFPTTVGEALFGDDTDAQFIRVTQANEKELYKVSNTAHKMQKITASDLALGDINSAFAVTQAVGALISKDQQEVYVYGLNQGTTDITISDGTDFATVVAINGASLSTTIAKEALPTVPSGISTWSSSATTIAKVRGGHIYTQEPGTALLEASIGSMKVFMNVVVTRNDNRVFKITPELVMESNTAWSNVQVLDGANIVAVHDNKLYAQQAGTAIVQVMENNTKKLFEVTVTKNADKTLSMEMSSELTKVNLTQQQLGLTGTDLENPVIASINGNGVVDAFVVDNELVVLAKATGQATVTVNNSSTTIHFEVTKTNGALNIQKTIASYALPDAQFYKGDQDSIRITDDAIFALVPGKAIVKTTEGLYNVAVVNENNKLLPNVSRIEYEFKNAALVEVASGTVLKVVDNNKIVALDFGTTTVTVDQRTYKVTVNEDGTLDVILYANGSFDFGESDLSNEFTTALTATSNKGLTSITTEGSKVTIQPTTTVTAAGTDIVTVSNGTHIVQLKVAIEEDTTAATPTFKVANIELISKTLNAGDLNGTYAHEVLNPDGTAAASLKALVTASNGKLTIYPGEAGTAHFIVRDSEGKQIFLEVQSTPTTPEQSFTARPLVQVIENNAFGYNPQILATHGKGLGIVDGEALNVTFADTKETIFVTTSGNNLYHTVLAKATVNGDLFTLASPIVQEAKVIDGTITNLTEKLNAITHNGKTILYATEESPSTGYFTDKNGIINMVTVADDYKISTEIVVEVTNPATTYSAVEHMSGDEVVTLHGDKLAIKQVGTGVYKINDTDYVKVNVTFDAVDGYKVEKTVFETHDLSDIADSVTVLAPTTGVYVDGLTIFGDTTEKVAISVTKDGKQSIYTAKEATIQETFDKLTKLEVDLLSVLGWTNFTNHTLASTSQFGEIDITTKTFTPKTLNSDGEVVVFTSPAGISKEVKFSLGSDFELKAVAGNDTYTYYMSQYEDVNSNMTFTLTFDMNLENVTLPLIETPTGGTASFEGDLILRAGVNDAFQGTYKIKMPDTNPLVKHTFTVEINKIDGTWQIPTLNSNTATFNYK